MVIQVLQRLSINIKSINISQNEPWFCINLSFFKRILGSNLWCLIYIICQKSTVKRKVFTNKKLNKSLQYGQIIPLWSSCKRTLTSFKSSNLNSVQNHLVTTLLRRHACTFLLKQSKSYALLIYAQRYKCFISEISMVN